MRIYHHLTFLLLSLPSASRGYTLNENGLRKTSEFDGFGGEKNAAAASDSEAPSIISTSPSAEPSTSGSPSVSKTPSTTPSISASPSAKTSSSPSVSNVPSTTPSISALPSVITSNSPSESGLPTASKAETTSKPSRIQTEPPTIEVVPNSNSKNGGAPKGGQEKPKQTGRTILYLCLSGSFAFGLVKFVQYRKRVGLTREREIVMADPNFSTRGHLQEFDNEII